MRDNIDRETPAVNARAPAQMSAATRNTLTCVPIRAAGRMKSYSLSERPAKAARQGTHLFAARLTDDYAAQNECLSYAS
jgi:hypothetical protein